MKLDGFSLQQALTSIYSTFASVLAGCAQTDAPDLHRKEIPSMVFDAAVGAGWIPLADPATPTGTGKDAVVWQSDLYDVEKVQVPEAARRAAEDQLKKGRRPPTPATFNEYQLARLVQFGDFIVDRVYLDRFFALLTETIEFHLAQGTKHEENLKRLPHSTSKEERSAYLQNYISKEEAQGNAITKKEIARRAHVDYSVLVKWKNKTAPLDDDSSDTAQRIMLFLLFNERNPSRTYRIRDVKSDSPLPRLF
jgi:hypothetical protein